MWEERRAHYGQGINIYWRNKRPGNPDYADYELEAAAAAAAVMEWEMELRESIRI